MKRYVGEDRFMHFLIVLGSLTQFLRSETLLPVKNKILGDRDI